MAEPRGFDAAVQTYLDKMRESGSEAVNAAQLRAELKKRAVKKRPQRGRIMTAKEAAASTRKPVQARLAEDDPKVSAPKAFVRDLADKKVLRDVMPEHRDKVVTVISDTSPTERGASRNVAPHGMSLEKLAIHGRTFHADEVEREVTPEGYEHVVRALKKKPGVENPWAVAWAMRDKGEAEGWLDWLDGSDCDDEEKDADGRCPDDPDFDEETKGEYQMNEAVKALHESDATKRFRESYSMSYDAKSDAATWSPELGCYTREQAAYGYAADPEKSCGTCRWWGGEDNPVCVGPLCNFSARKIDTCRFHEPKKENAK